MAKNPRQKLKLLQVMKFLLEKTDDDHRVSIKDICEHLSSLGINSERKSIYDDLHTLESFGLDVCTHRDKTVTYYIGRREFELPELKLLVDAVQSSKFITHKKSMELIKKIERLASDNEARQLQRQVFVTNRVKAPNEKIYYNVDKLHNAVSQDRAVTFLYTSWAVNFGANEKIKKEYRRGGNTYSASPFCLMWDDENYYMVAYDHEKQMIRHFRVDKMEKIDILDEKRMGRQEFAAFDLAAYSKTVFGMFGGRPQRVTLCADNSLIGVFVDRFGKDIFISDCGNGRFSTDVTVVASPQFFGWLFGLGGGTEIVEPQEVRREFVGFLDSVRRNYETTDK